MLSPNDGILSCCRSSGCYTLPLLVQGTEEPVEECHDADIGPSVQGMLQCCSAAGARQQSSCDCQPCVTQHWIVDSVSVTKGGNSVYTWPSSKQMTQTGSATH